MSACGQSGQTEEDSASEEAGNVATRDIYKQKPTSKLVRVLTVLAYLLSVSLAAILLSVYYVCVWKSPELPLQDTLDASDMAARHAHHTDIRYAEYIQHTVQTARTHGGGDTAMSGDIVHSAPENITDGFAGDGATTEPSTEPLNSTVLPFFTTDSQNETSDVISNFEVTGTIT